MWVMLEFCGDRSRKVAVVRCVIAGLLLAAVAPGAQAYSARVNTACENDYYRFCSAYAVGSTSLNACMEASRNSLTKRCIDALVAEGLVPRKYLTRR
jgi:hypothetical protein